MNDIRYGRKKSGIKRQLKAKISEWIESIEDEEIRELCKKHTIVTGGSIASMLLGEQVNDYDVYFRNLKTAKEVARYYVDKFNKTKKDKGVGEDEVEYEPIVVLNPYVKDTNFPLYRTYDADGGVSEQSFRDRAKIKFGEDYEEEQRVMIWMQSAGIAAEDQNDYQYFEMRGEDETVDFAESLNKEDCCEGAKYRPVFLSQNAITLSNKIQIVIRFHGEPHEIHNNYDFVHAMNYYDYGNDSLVLKQEALECLLSRTLIYRGSLYPVASVFRTKKFIERGWRITAGEQLKMMWQISELNLKDFNTIREQLTGVDMAYLWQLTQALKDVSSDKINSSYVAAIIDKVFD